MAIEIGQVRLIPKHGMSRLLPGLLDQLFSVTRFGTIHILRTSVQLVCVKREILMDSIF